MGPRLVRRKSVPFFRNVCCAGCHASSRKRPASLPLRGSQRSSMERSGHPSSLDRLVPELRGGWKSRGVPSFLTLMAPLGVPERAGRTQRALADDLARSLDVRSHHPRGPWSGRGTDSAKSGSEGPVREPPESRMANLVRRGTPLAKVSPRTRPSLGDGTGGGRGLWCGRRRFPWGTLSGRTRRAAGGCRGRSRCRHRPARHRRRRRRGRDAP